MALRPILWRAWAATMLCAAMAEAEGQARVVARFADFAAGGPWETWCPRPEIAPAFHVDAGAGRAGGSCLAIEAGPSSAAIGAWRTEVRGITPGRSYRFTAWHRAERVAHPVRAISARLDWRKADGSQARPPDYALEAGAEGGWTRLQHVTTAPDGAASVRMELGLQWAPGGRVLWDDITLEELGAMPRRIVRAMTVFHRPQGTKSPADSVEQFCRLVEDAAGARPDVVCLPEGITLVGTGRSYLEVSEPVPGPTTRRLGELARRLNAYVCAGILEREGAVVYNTAVLMDRAGRLAGKYRKTHLPREEVEGGVTPGNSYPVFDTDFGRVGLMICWDVQFPEPARAMAAQGAEMLLLPIWGGSETLAKARAIENHVFLVSSSYDMKTFVVDPAGQVRAEATASEPVVVAELDLNARIIQPWLGDMKARTWKERRADLPVP